MNHTETWCVTLPRVLVTEPLPESATKALLHPLRAPWAAWLPSWAPIPAPPCSQAPPALWDWAGHLQQLLLLPGLLQVRGASLTAGASWVQSDVPHACALQGSPHTASGASSHLPRAPASPTQLFPVRSRAGGSGGSSAGGAGDNTYTPPAGSEGRGDAHAETDGRTDGSGARPAAFQRLPGAVSTCACTCRCRPCSWDTCVSRP